MKNQSVTLTITLPLDKAQHLLDYAKENNDSIDDTVSRLIERPEAAFNEMHHQITALECLVGALIHDLYNPNREPHLIAPIDLANKNIPEMTAEDILKFVRFDDEGEWFLRHFAEHKYPLISDGHVIAGALTGRTIKSVHTISNLDTCIGVGLLTEDGYMIDLLAVKKKYDEEKGFLGGLNEKASTKMIWSVFKGT